MRLCVVLANRSKRINFRTYEEKVKIGQGLDDDDDDDDRGQFKMRTRSGAFVPGALKRN